MWVDVWSHFDTFKSIYFNFLKSLSNDRSDRLQPTLDHVLRRRIYSMGGAKQLRDGRD